MIYTELEYIRYKVKKGKSKKRDTSNEGEYLYIKAKKISNCIKDIT